MFTAWGWNCNLCVVGVVVSAARMSLTNLDDFQLPTLPFVWATSTNAALRSNPSTRTLGYLLAIAKVVCRDGDRKVPLDEGVRDCEQR